MESFAEDIAALGTRSLNIMPVRFHLLPRLDSNTAIQHDHVLAADIAEARTNQKAPNAILPSLRKALSIHAASCTMSTAPDLNMGLLSEHVLRPLPTARNSALI